LSSRRGAGRIAGYLTVAAKLLFTHLAYIRVGKAEDGQKDKLVVQVISCTFLSLVGSVMVICENLKDKVIIVAENDEQLATEISHFLKDNGFVKIKIAQDGGKVYEILRPYYNEPEQIGLIVINEALPRCHVLEMSRTLSSNQEGTVIPFIIFGSNEENISYDQVKEYDLHSQCLNHFISVPINYAELLTVMRFQLMMKHERFLRHKQAERLIDELAERKIVDAKLKYLVAHDELTSLLNRQNFERRLRQILNRSNMLQQNGALLFFDVDRFSLINELEGFETGDRLLVEVVSIIRKIADKTDLFARIGSDEFCLFLENKTNYKIKQFAEKIRRLAYDYKFFTGDICYSISLSIGIAGLSASKAIYHPSELISRARQACMMAKRNGRNTLCEYNEHDTKVQERHRDIYWVPLIKRALIEESFFLVFQPVVDLLSGNVSHYEVLIRMRGADNEIVSPANFIPVAERMGLIHSIDLWVIDQAIDFLAALSSHSLDISLAINLSSTAFQDDSLLPAIKDKLDITWVDAKRITFEITETAAVENFEQTRLMIEKIRALGCRFALDDFGAGFCSFNYLKSFPVDYVKIDGQFIRNLTDDETDQVLVKSMAEIAASLGKKTIAEFVETPETVAMLKKIGVNLAQGYIFGKPKEQLLTNHSISILDLINKANNRVSSQKLG